MAWKKIAESNDLIVLEKQFKKHKLKIEARKNSYGWEVFRTKVNGASSSLISEHILDTKKEAIQLIDKLKKETKIKVKEIQKTAEISLMRVYKEEFVEKWYFIVNDGKIKNFLVVKYDNNIKVDIVMHELYRLYEDEIISQIEKSLGLKELGESSVFEIYYFKRAIKNRENAPQKSLIDIEFGFDEDYY
ncbi:hypothetical protein HN789_00615 [archaeon]|jgi:hypothetical protein|nr:hypothetical protein [archaeon]MBT4022031.1 hypothetical protein [archaeon]MBT4272644.1 hypothetical protein [archaeon]MBT4461442.1 hypothetical protein [archaeon]MBT4857788.1 hypothetical protein [archaeon]